MDSPRLDATQLNIGPDNGAIMVTHKPKFFWVDLTTRPGIALTYAIDTKDCWGPKGFDPDKAVLDKQMPRPLSMKTFSDEFMVSDIDDAGKSGVYYIQTGVRYAVRMGCDFCVHNFDHTEWPSGNKGDWLVTNGEMKMPVSAKSFEQKFVRVDSFNAMLKMDGPDWARDDFGLPMKDQRRMPAPDNVLPFRRRETAVSQLGM
jgi:hypothetical protein